MAQGIDNSGNSYQKGTTAEAVTARRVLFAGPQQAQGAPNVPATLTTNLTGNNNDLVYRASAAGTVGNALTVTYAVAGNNTPLTVTVSGNAITVNVATDGGGAPTSTAAQVAAAVAAATSLVSVSNAPGNDGTGVVTALATTSLSGGSNETLGPIGNQPFPTIPPIHYTYG